MNDRRLYIGGGLIEGNRFDALKPGLLRPVISPIFTKCRNRWIRVNSHKKGEIAKQCRLAYSNAFPPGEDKDVPAWRSCI
jgi:hypothetical protein